MHLPLENMGLGTNRIKENQEMNTKKAGIGSKVKNEIFMLMIN